MIAVKTLALLAVMAMAPPPHAPGTMAPLHQYLMDRTAEIALARSAAPPALAKDAEVLVLGRQGYEVAVPGHNGFVCLVHRSWTSGGDDPEFWNPTRRGPMCLNPAAAKSYLPNTLLRTRLVLAGKSENQMFDALKAAYAAHRLPAMAPGAMCYMLAKGSHLSDRDGHWRPHLMFYLPPGAAAAWGADNPGSPIMADEELADHTTVMMVPVAHWSDGTPDDSSPAH